MVSFLQKKKVPQMGKISLKSTEKKHIRIDLVIFGILIYILGMLVGIILGIGISEGELSIASFQRFISSEEDVQIEDAPSDDVGTNKAVVVNPNSKVSGNGPLVVSGTVVTGGDSASSVSEVSDNNAPQAEDQGNPFADDEDNVPAPLPSDYDD